MGRRMFVSSTLPPAVVLPEAIRTLPATVASLGVASKVCVLAGVVGATLAPDDAIAVLTNTVASAWVSCIWVIAALATINEVLGSVS